MPGTDLELGKKSLAKEVSEGRASNSIPSRETVLLASQGTGLVFNSMVNDSKLM